MYHPWRALRALSQVEVFWMELTGRRMGATDGHEVIVLSPDLTQAERRCTLTHELIHIEHGHTGGCSAWDEAATAQLAARRLIPVEALAEALVWSTSVPVLAEELWVDQATLRNRLEHLHPSEVHYIRQRLAAREEGA